MDDDTYVHECQISFFLHLWREPGERPWWRGRVIDGEGKNSGAFEDEEALLNFIRSRLLNDSIALPWRRGDLDSDLAVPRLLEMK